jgi:hypothetical protein
MAKRTMSKRELEFAQRPFTPEEMASIGKGETMEQKEGYYCTATAEGCNCLPSQSEMLGWVDRLAKLNALVAEGHGILDRISGPQIKEQDGRKSPNCQAAALMDEIRVAEIEVGALVARLEDLTGMF